MKLLRERKAGEKAGGGRERDRSFNPEDVNLILKCICQGETHQYSSLVSHHQRLEFNIISVAIYM